MPEQTEIRIWRDPAQVPATDPVPLDMALWWIAFGSAPSADGAYPGCVDVRTKWVQPWASEDGSRHELERWFQAVSENGTELEQLRRRFPEGFECAMGALRARGLTDDADLEARRGMAAELLAELRADLASFAPQRQRWLDAEAELVRCLAAGTLVCRARVFGSPAMPIDPQGVPLPPAALVLVPAGHFVTQPTAAARWAVLHRLTWAGAAHHAGVARGPAYGDAHIERDGLLSLWPAADAKKLRPISPGAASRWAEDYKKACGSAEPTRTQMKLAMAAHFVGHRPLTKDALTKLRGEVFPDLTGPGRKRKPLS